MVPLKYGTNSSRNKGSQRPNDKHNSESVKVIGITDL